jgi:hypothetical protein
MIVVVAIAGPSPKGKRGPASKCSAIDLLVATSSLLGDGWGEGRVTSPTGSIQQ